MTDRSYVVVFGLDPEGRPRASRFTDRDATLAVKAARYLGYRSLRIADAGLAEMLPPGDVFARGDAFVRRVSRARVEQLCAAASHPARRLERVGL